MIKFYIVPIVLNEDNERVPKYMDDVSSWGAMDYGNEPTMLVRADVTVAQHDSITLNPDVLTVPGALNDTVGGALAATQTALENLNIPANWINNTMTWKTVLKGIAAIFQLSQRLQGQGLARLFDSGITLATTFGSLSSNLQARLINMADSFGFDRSGLNSSSTIRQILITLGQQWIGSIRFGQDNL